MRVLKPGGHLLAFGGTRTWHRLAVAVEDAGFEMRDSIAWLYAQGFPKSMDVGKAIDKAAGAERAVVGSRTLTGTAASSSAHVGNLAGGSGVGAVKVVDVTAPATPDAEQWQGWGTALKPAHEPVVWGRKPLDARAFLARIGSQLAILEDSCKPPANGAASSSAPTRHALREARTATAPEPVATPHEDGPARTTRTGAAAGSSEATATSVFEWTGETFWNTVTSWRKCWAELCEATSTSTTSTATSRTTDLQTLSSCLSQITQSVTATSTPDPDSLRSLVTAADNLFAAGVLNSRSILALSAAESATASTPRASQDAGGSSPAFEPVVCARKPLKGTVAQNVLTYGTGALNVDACRITASDQSLERPTSQGSGRTTAPHVQREATRAGEASADRRYTERGGTNFAPLPGVRGGSPSGRWPANVVLDESQAAALDEQSGESVSKAGGSSGTHFSAGSPGVPTPDRPRGGHNDSGGASRFFYTAKATSAERPRYTRPKLRLRGGLTPEQVDHVRARLAEAGVQVD